MHPPLPSPPVIVHPGTIKSLILYGSHAHGTATPKSDADWRGVYQLPNEDFLGLDVPVQTYDQKPDIVLWELAHFARLLLKGNPNLVGQLWVPDDCIVIDDDIMSEFRAVRALLITTAMVSSYIGWAASELNRALTPKQLSHVPRLMWEIEGAIVDRDIPVRLPKDKRDIVMAIKTGETPMEEALALARSLLREVRDLEAKTPLPDPPRAIIREIVLDARAR